MTWFALIALICFPGQQTRECYGQQTVFRGVTCHEVLEATRARLPPGHKIVHQACKTTKFLKIDMGEGE